MLRTLIAALLLSGAASWSAALDLDPREMAQTLFERIDEDGVGAITESGAAAFDELVLVSMDTDENGGVSREEFLAWGIGFTAVAQERERSQAHETASRVIFGMMDYDSDGEAVPGEIDRFQSAAFDYADQDGDSELSADEFHDHHLLNIANRAAVRPLE